MFTEGCLLYTVKMAKKEVKFLRIMHYFQVLCLLMIIRQSNSKNVVDFEISDWSDDSAKLLRKRDTAEGCQNEIVLDKLREKGNEIDKAYTFPAGFPSGVAVTWAGDQEETLILVFTSAGLLATTGKSVVFRSNDFGVTFEDITTRYKIEKTIKNHKGLQRHPYDPKKIYLISNAKILYLSEDGGQTFDTVITPMDIERDLIFHPSKHYQNSILAKSQSRELFLSVDNGRTWNLILENCHQVYWGNPDIGCCDSGATVYATRGGTMENLFFPTQFNYSLVKSEGTTEWIQLLENVISFERSGNVLLSTVFRDPNNPKSRHSQVSVDGGRSWQELQLHTPISNEYQRVVQISENMIFMHMDNPNHNDIGMLYTSGRDGFIYSESLRNHMFQQYGVDHGFYKVKSMHGVYITNQLRKDYSIHSMISYNSGGTWQKIARPENAACKNESRECYLQIHGVYSMKRGINTVPPESHEGATGLILAHGHVADSLQTTDPDVFISNDGGYTWRLTLKGPHHYTIGDHGGLLVAVSKSDPQSSIVKFSVDGGYCWREYTFTNETFNCLGILTQPDGDSSVVAVWGYTADKLWKVHVLNFREVLSDQCEESDYVPWVPGPQHQTEDGMESMGCILGQRETFVRLRKNSWCYNGYPHKTASDGELCTCTKNDYQCGYAFYRPDGSNTCEQRPDFHCRLNNTEWPLNILERYRRIPGDICVGGFQPGYDGFETTVNCTRTETSTTTFTTASPSNIIEVNTTAAITHSLSKSTRIYTSAPASTESEHEDKRRKHHHHDGKGGEGNITLVVIPAVAVIVILTATLSVYFIRRQWHGDGLYINEQKSSPGVFRSQDKIGLV